MLKQACTTVAIACLFGCGGSGGGSTTSPPPPGVNTPAPIDGIAVTNNLFTPASKTVPIGTAVQWAWNTCTDSYTGQTCVAHDIVFDDGVTSGRQDQGTFVRTFNTAGIYNYHCSIHGATVMSGSVTVQ